MAERSGPQSLPDGPLALVFTDVEGSTELWQRDEDAFGWALVEHDHEVRDCLVRHHGVEIKHTGDGFFLAFRNAVDAARFCLELQTRLTNNIWPQEIGPIRTRIGLHVGAPRRHGNDFRGQAVNLASRVCDATHGGQIQLTAEAAKALAVDSELHRRLNYQGGTTLPGIREKVDLYELTCDATRRLKFPPLGSVRTTNEVNGPPTYDLDQLTEAAFSPAERELWSRSRAALRRADHKSAIALLLRLHNLHPDNLRVLSALGIAYSYAEQWERAEHCLKRAVNIDRKHAASWFNLARVYGKMGRRQDIGYALAMTLKAAPNHEKAREVAAKYGVEIPPLPDD